MYNDNKINTLLTNIIKLKKETTFSSGRISITEKGLYVWYFIDIDLFIESKEFSRVLLKVEDYILNNRFFKPNLNKYYKPIKKYKLIKHNRLCRKIKV